MGTEIHATYQVVTPLFCSGADQEHHPELRLPSFKGVLRYWWRALAWSRYEGDLKEIQYQEDTLFGSASGGQARVIMRLKGDAKERKTREKGLVLETADKKSVVGPGARYLGYGVMEAFGSRKKDTKDGQLTRPCLLPFQFTVCLRGRGLNEEDVGLLKDALITLGVLGGMGAKSRKGYGSLALTSLQVDNEGPWQAPPSTNALNALRKEISRLQKTYQLNNLPEYTALSRKTRLVLVQGDDDVRDPLVLLDRIGRELVRYRSWGRHGTILGNEDIDSEKNFRDDHDLMKLEPRKRRKHPRRIAFGLPHNYGKEQVVPHKETELDRRASPLFVHIHQCGGMPVAVLSFLPARFLPHGKSTLSVGGHKVSLAAENELYRPVDDFLNRLLNQDERKEDFARVIEIQQGTQ